MKTKKTIFKLNLSFLIAIFSLFALTACSGCSSNPKGPKSKDDTKALNQPNLKNVIVLLHGLGCPKDPGIAELGGKLGLDIKNSEIIILDRENSGAVPTTQQAEETYVALKTELEKKKLMNSPICLFGDSHGGLVALELYRNHKKDLNVIGIITNHSPLEGAPGINASPEAITNFIEALKNIIPSNIKAKINPMLQMFNLGATLDDFLDGLDLKKILTDDIQEPVRQDLTTNSTLLENVKKTLLNIKIPVLLLGAEVDIKTAIIALLGFVLGEDQFAQFIVSQFKNILNGLSLEDLKKLKKNFIDIIGNEKNDAFIPTYSQISESILENTPQNIRRVRSKTYHHFYRTTRHAEIYNKLVEFINQAFEVKK
jgi:hypothetical protein